MKIYGDMRSGNCLKVKYVSDYLGIPYDWQEVDVMSGYTRRAEFLALNPAGQIPLVQFDDGRLLSQSNAIMLYLAHGTDLSFDDPWQTAKVNEWLFWEQYSHEPSIAVVRFMRALKKVSDDEIPAVLVAKGNAALDLMETHLQERAFFVGDRLSVADVALLAYTQFAGDGGFSLETRPRITAWIERTRAALGQPA
jgi:glutathione S-transferase